MNSDWENVSIDALKSSESGSIAVGPFGSKMKSDCYSASGVRVVRGTNITSEQNFNGDFVYIPEAKAKELGSANLKPYDLVLPHRGAIGEVGIVPDDGQSYVLSSSMMKLSCNMSRVSPFFLYYYFRSEKGRFELLKNASQVGTPGIGQPLASLKSILVLLPPLCEQKSIASILRILDDRIRLLRETNTTLEAISQALFKSWFVDFDPVRAKAEGCAPEGMDEATAALFPDSFEESELGMIPKSWAAAPIGDAVNIVGGGTPSTKHSEYWMPEDYSWTSPKDLSGASSPILLQTEKRISAAGLATISSGLLPCGTLLLSSRAPIGYLAITRIPVAINQGYIALLPDSILPPLFMFCWCKHYMDTIEGHANGSTFMEISKKAFRLIPTVIPSLSSMSAFLQIVSGVFDRIAANEEQACTLTAIRDTLLPRLISGKLRLPEFATDAPESAV